jgi:FkbM family methyltransferase
MINTSFLKKILTFTPLLGNFVSKYNTLREKYNKLREEHDNLREEYKKRQEEIKQLVGIMTKADSIHSYLLYPGFDQAQLLVTLTGEPYQLSDFNNCLKFLKNNHWITPEKSIFLDIGANIGSMSIYAIASGAFTQAIAVEPSSLNFQFLQWNIKINNLDNKIQPIQCGLADFLGVRNIICSPYNCGDFRMSSSSDKNSNNLYHEEQFTTEQVPFSTLDCLSDQYNIAPEKIGWICIDCQGSEGLIFKGGQEFLQKASAPIYVEFWPYGINRLGCCEEYFDFIIQYPAEIFRWVDNQPEPITLDFLKNFYAENVQTTLHLDILLLPARN